MKTEADLNISIEGKQVFKVKFGCRIMILVKNNAVHVFRHDQQHHPCHPPHPPTQIKATYIFILPIIISLFPPHQVTIRIQGHSDLYTFYFNKWLSANKEVTLHGEIVSTPIYVLLPQLRVMPGNCSVQRFILSATQANF